MVARILVALVVSMMLVSGVSGPGLSHQPPPPPPPPDHPKEGCTPGYWKQEHHFDSWVGFSPGQRLSGTGGAGFIFPDALASFRTMTLLQALQGGGGPGLTGATRILMRAAVAALLNAANPNVAYGFSVADVRNATNSALASLSRSDMLNQAAEWDRFNNLGCPLN